MDVGRVKVEVWGDKRLGLTRPAGAKSFWRQVLVEMPVASSSGMTTAITEKESHFVLTIPREEVAWMQGGINLQPAGHGPRPKA